MSLDEIRRVLRLDDPRVWLLIGLCVALVFTIQSVETATEGAWPHQRRPSRIAPQARLCPSVRVACELLAQIRGSTRPPFVRLADHLGADSLPSWADTPAATTDGHLSALALARASRLATLDEGIPGSFLIPA